MAVKSKTYKRLIIETDDEATYNMFGLDEEYEEMVIDKDGLCYLESYLYDLEDEEDGRVDEETWEMFNKIKEALQEYKEVQVVYNKELK